MLHSLLTTSLLARPACSASASQLVIAPHTQSCSAKVKAFSESPKYTVNIGEPFANGASCGGTQDAWSARLGIAVGGIIGHDDGEGMTRLRFPCCQGRGADLNAVLHGWYPMVNGWVESRVE